MTTWPSILAAPVGDGGGGGSKSPVALLLVGLVFVIVAGTQAINPRLLWRLNRWKYKNPDANEPSEKAFLLQRVVGAVLAVVGIVLIVVAITKF